MRTLALVAFLAPAFADAAGVDWLQRRAAHVAPKSRKSRQPAPFQLARKWSGSAFLDGSWNFEDIPDVRARPATSTDRISPRTASSTI